NQVCRDYFNALTLWPIEINGQSFHRMCFLHDEVSIGQLPIPYFFIEVLFVFSSKSFCFHKLLRQLDVSSTNSSSDHSRSVTFAIMSGVTRKAGRAINHATLPA